MWAHSMGAKGVRHTLEDHLRGSADLGFRFAEPFGLADLAWWTCLIHDGGKAWCVWQEGLDRAEQSNGRVGVPHKDFGVSLARTHKLWPVEWAVAGHHGGLTRRAEVDALFGEDEQAEAALRSGPWADAEQVLRRLVPEIYTRVPALPAVFAVGADRLMGDFALRMLFSCLVDADALDTRSHRLGLPVDVGSDLNAAQALERFLSRRKEGFKDRRLSPMSGLREQVFNDAMRQSALPPGIFRMTAPTGAAKTIAGAGFALSHAAQHGKRRVIVAVPFITITEQNAKVYRDLLDPLDPAADRVVLEHHSGVNLEPASDRRRHSWQLLAAENWDAPFVVTTTVQLFESLFGRRPSQMRKLHRIANSVIILDEVQALPHRLLPQIADALRILTTRFGATVVLSSATQPELWSFGPLSGLKATEIVADTATVFARSRRVRFQWRVDPQPTLERVTAEACAYERVLMVVNTVANARTVFEHARRLAPSGTSVLHLSTGMCGLHRRRVLDSARKLLHDGGSLVLVSTSLIEAGVDVDFPVVFRAVAPPESEAQAAGRCNREGSLGVDGGLVVIFDPADGGLPPSYRLQLGKANKHFGPQRAYPDDLAALQRYFPDLYSSMNLEGPDSVSELIMKSRRDRDFRSVADGPLKSAGSSERDRDKAFRMITEDTVSAVVADYGTADDRDFVRRALSRLRGRDPDLRAIRDLQPFITTIRRSTARQPAVAANLLPVVGDLFEWCGNYDEGFGMVIEPRTEDFIL